jgi:hypothetical protein
MKKHHEITGIISLLFIAIQTFSLPAWVRQADLKGNSGVSKVGFPIGDSSMTMAPTLGSVPLSQTSVVNVSITASKNPACTGDNVCFNATVTNGGTNPFYQWFVNGNLVQTSGSVPNGLIAWYPFNGNANDESGKGNNGTVHGATLANDRFGHANRAYSFDGADDYIDINDNSNYHSLSKITLSLWFKANASTPTWVKLFGKHYDASDGSFYLIWENNSIRFSAITPTQYGGIVSGNLLDGLWHNAVGVYDGVNISLFIDGVLVSTATNSGAIKETNYHIIVGKSERWTTYYNGLLDDMRLYNRALSVSEIQSLYLEGDPGLCYFPSNGDNIYCVLTSSDPNATNNPDTSNVIVMNVNPLLPVSVTIAASNNPVCTGDTVCFTATPTNGGTNPKYTWMVNGDINQGLIAWYPLNGNANDASGHGNNGIEHGTSYTTDRFNRPNSSGLISGNVGTNGSCKYIQIPNMINGLEQFTISIWVDEESMTYPHGNFYISFGEYFGLGHILNTQTMVDKLLIAVRTQASGIIENGYPFNPSFLIGFQHYVLTFNGNSGEYVCYQNGSSKLTGTFTPGAAYAPGTGAGLGWGSYTGCCTRFNGKVDDVRIYNRALSVSEVQSLYYEGNSEFCYVPSNGDTVNCVLTSNETCATNNPDTSNMIIMNVNPFLPVGVTIAASNNPVCAGDTVCFTATPTNGGTNPGYNWVVNGNNMNEGLVAYYPFNGNANDESGNGNNGIAGGDFQFANGVAGSSLHVTSHSSGSDCDNASGGNVTLPNLHFTGMNSFSYSLWVKDEGITCGVAAYIYFRDDPYGTPYAGIMRTDNSLHFMAGVNNANDIIVAPYLSSYGNSFVNYCLVYNNGITTAYINGNPAGSKPQPVNVDGIYSAIARSWYNDKTSTRLTGTIDQVRIYDRALSPSEVHQLYYEGNPEFCYVPANNDMVYCTLTSGNTCNTNNPDTSNMIIMNVNPTPPVSVSIVASENPVCHADTVTFTAIPVNGGTNPSCQWFVNGNPANSLGILPAGLVAWYPFSGNPNDSTSHHNDGSVHNAILTNDRFGNPNSAYHFNGSDSYIQITSKQYLNPPNTLTLSAWVRLSDYNSSSSYIIDKHRAYPNSALTRAYLLGVYGPLYGDQGLMYTSADGGSQENVCTSNEIFPLNQWIHLTGTFDHGTEKIYINGVLKNTNLGSYDHIFNNHPVKDLFIGALVDNGGILCQTNGDIDDVRIYDRALSASEIEQLYMGIDSTFSYVPENNDTVYCVITSSNTCVSNNPSTSNMIVMTSISNPVAEIIGPDSICNGMAATYTTNGGMSNYQWTVTGNPVINGGGTTTDSAITVTWNSFGNNEVSVKYSNLCNEIDSASYAVHIEKSDTISVSITASASIVCSGDTVVFTPSALPFGEKYAYHWYVNDSLVYTSGGIPENGLVAWYPFNGNANDISGNGYNGTALGPVLTSDRFGNPNSAYFFNGYDNRIEVPNSPALNITGDLTISAWFNSIEAPTFRTSHTLLTKRSSESYGNFPYLVAINYQYGYPSDYRKSLFSSAKNNIYQYFQSANDIAINTWNHYACVIKNDSIKIFYNNILIINTLINNQLRVANSYPLLIGSGGRTDPPAEFFKGKLDDLRLYNYALSDSNVQQLSSEGSSTFSYIPSNNDTIFCILTSSSACALNNPDTSNKIIIHVNPNPPSPVSGGNMEVCSNTLPATLSVIPGDGNSADWYDAASGGNMIQFNSSTFSASTAGTYYAESRNNTTGCVSATRTAVNLAVIPANNVYYRDSDEDGFGNPDVHVFDCSQPAGYVVNNEDCNDNNPNVYPEAQYFTFTGNAGYESSIVSPPTGTPYTYFHFQADYFDLSDALPAPGYPKLILDYEGNGNYTDALDRTLIMTPDNQNDLTTLDGKRYIADISGLQYGATYKTQIITSDGASCFNTFGPFDAPVILQQPNIYLFANDITFSNYHPDPSENLIVYAVIHNESDYPAENFQVHLENQGDPSASYPDLTVTYIPPHESTTVQWLITTPSVPAWCPMKVTIDYSDVILETNELDNTAVRPFLNGDFQLPGGINCSVNVSPVVVCAGHTATLLGSAVYYGTAVPLPDYSVAGATVEFQILETTTSYTGYTNSYGNFCINFGAPMLAGTYHVSGTVTDYTLTGEFITEFSVVDCPPPPPPPLPDLIISSLDLPAYCIEPGAPVSGTVTVKNIGTVTAGSSYVTFWQNSGTPFTAIHTPPLDPDESFTSAIGPVVFNSEGDFSICANADGTHMVTESDEFNNITCRTVHVDECWDMPDIIPVEGPANTLLDCFLPAATSFKLYNAGCMPAGPFTCEIIATPSSGQSTTITVTVPGIGGKSYYNFSIPYIYGSLGLYCFEIRCDIPTETGGVVEECREYNNVATYCRVICACKPNLTMEFCNSLDVLPENIQYPGTALLVARVKNNGLGIAPPPIEVDFTYIPGEVYEGHSDEPLLPGQTVTITATGPVPIPATTILDGYADPNDIIDETDETDNEAADWMCYEFQPVPFPYLCGYNFWNYIYQKNQSVTLSVGLNVRHLYHAGPVKVKFEVSGPGITGSLNLGYGILQHVSKLCCYCPYTVVLPDPFTFPDCGTYTFTMTADPENDYPECNEGNNVMVVNVEVKCPCEVDCCKPNLTFRSCKGLEVRPVNPFYPDDCQLVAHVLNNGNCPAYPPVRVDFTYNTAGVYSGYYWDVISPGETVEITADAMLPPPATTMLTACIDPLDEIDEWNEDDNCISDNMCWEFQPVAQCGPHFWDHCYMVGQSLYFSIGLAVSHLYDASPVKVKFEVMGPGIQGKQTAGYGYLSYATRLCYYCPAVVVSQMPYTFSEAGIYTVIITADPENIYTECNESNNVFEVNVCVNDYLPDMRVLSQFINPSLLNPDPGEEVSFLMSYENIAASNIGDNMKMNVLVDGSPFYSLYPVEGLVSGEHDTKAIPQNWSSLIPGIHIIRLIIDSDNEINETNENNNEATRAIIVGIAANPGFKSFIPSETLPDINEQISITAKIGNDGSQTCNTNVKFQYINNMADTVVIGVTSVIVPGHDSTIVTIPWVVADTNTTLIGTIFETNVPEFNYEDNLATAGIGEGISITLSSANACQGKNNGTLTAIATGGIDPYQFNWINGYIGDTLTDSAGVYTVIVYDNTGMSKTATGTINSYPLTMPGLTGPDSLCGIPSSGNIYFTESGMSDYQWNISPGGLVTSGGGTADTSIMVAWNTTGQKFVTVNYTDHNGCSALVPALFQTQILPLPVPSVTGPDSICQHESGVMYVTDQGMADYSWTISPGGTILSGGDTPTLEVTWNQTGEQWVEVSYMGEYCHSEVKRFYVMVFEGTDPGTVTGGGSLWFGLEAFLTLEGNIGSVLKWQKRWNGGSWKDTLVTGTSYSEIPDTTGTWDYRAVVQNGNCSAFHSAYATVNVLPVTITLNLKLLLEGLYNPGTGIMNKAQDVGGDKYPGTVADKIKVRIAWPFSPYSDYFAQNDVDLNQDGTCSITVHRAGYYYLVVNHRNSIETWSALPIYSLPEATSYDFTIAVSQAFGDNQREISGKWTIWGGDVNQDGIVDAGDMNPVDNSTTTITFGYVPEDVNGDGIVDASDMNIVDNNTTAIIFVMSP